MTKKKSSTRRGRLGNVTDSRTAGAGWGLDVDRVSIARLILVRSKELALRQRVAPQLRGARATENAAAIKALTKGIADLHRHGLTRLRRWWMAAEKADGQS